MRPPRPPNPRPASSARRRDGRRRRAGRRPAPARHDPRESRRGRGRAAAKARPGRDRRAGRHAPGRPGRPASSMRPGGCRGDRDTRGTDPPGRACPRSPAQPGPAWRVPPARPRRPPSARAGPPGSGLGADAADAVRPAQHRHRDEHRRGIAQQPRTESLAEAGRRPALERARQLPGARSSAWRRSAAPRRSAAHRPRCGTPHRPLHRARHAMPPRSTRHSAGTGRPSARRAQQTDRRAQPATDHLEVAEPRRRVVLVAGQQECERLTRQWVCIEGAEQALQVRRGARCARGPCKARTSMTTRTPGFGSCRLARASPTAQEILQSKLHDHDEGLDDDPARHLALADPSVAEGDGIRAPGPRGGWRGMSSRSGRRSRRHGHRRTGQTRACWRATP